jgi:hypothetical protein
VIWIVFNKNSLAIHGQHYLKSAAKKQVKYLASKAPYLRRILEIENIGNIDLEQWKMWKELSK